MGRIGILEQRYLFAVALAEGKANLGGVAVNAALILVLAQEIGDVSIGLRLKCYFLIFGESTQAVFWWHLVVNAMPIDRKRLEQRLAIGVNILGVLNLATNPRVDVLL